MRHPSGFDQFLIRADKLLNTLTHSLPIAMPLEMPETEEPLSPSEQAEAGALMRVNHSGEVSAQALYLGQAMVARDPQLAESLYTAANEEKAHLAWCQARLTDLKTRPSLLNPLWAAGSFVIGALAGLCGDKVSLGFLAETEHQVSTHLEEHLQKLPKNDLKSKAVLEKMKEDELKHANNALKSGGIPLPRFVRAIMRKTAKIMTTTARHW